jgi:hypothetical protein
MPDMSIIGFIPPIMLAFAAPLFIIAVAPAMTMVRNSGGRADS